ncbi:hypothetical protein [Paenibacillus lutrae]|uniref:Uncharacterized protein n=1 Tax=Paenibacillus lutrae TaxID=2078573 RepID=A0A7X3JZN8_9BACL|nr:hypothetical protein [Paenibacillus lutrae]MVP00141.1 hypothetical protein [Paenibacillus lutrae]
MKKSVVSFLSAALLLSSLSSVALAEQSNVSPQGLITPKAVGADSGWQTQSNIRAKVYTNSTYYGAGSDTITVTAEKSTVGAAYYSIYLMSDTQMVKVASGTLGSSVTHQVPKSSLNPILNQYSQGNFKVLLKIFAYGDWFTWLGDWETTNSFIAVRLD